MKKTGIMEAVNLLKEKKLLIEANINAAACDETIEYISYNSQDIKPGTLFFCKGVHFKEQYLKEAFDKGTICYVSEKVIVADKPHIIVSDIRGAMLAISEMYYGCAWRDKLKLVGVTGTKGKTTTVMMIHSILEAHCRSHKIGRAGILTGVYNFDGRETIESSLTTPETFELHKILSNCVENQCSYLAMEVSSQALKYGRTAGLEYEVAVFLNMGNDHVSESEHYDMEDYFNSKLKIIDQCRRICINLDMNPVYMKRIMDYARKKGCEIITFGKGPEADYRGILKKGTIDYIEVEAVHGDEERSITANIGGKFNAENVMAAVSATKALGISWDAIKEGIEKVKVPGRMEVFRIPGRDTTVIADYAHNDISFEALFQSVNEAFPDKKKVIVFGSSGGRAFNRRRNLSEIADREADMIILSEEDCGTEGAEKICNELRSYISPEKDVKIILDREEAVKYALDNCRDGWVIIFAGHSTGDHQVRGEKSVPVACDARLVREYIESHR